MADALPSQTDRRALLAGLGGLAAGTFLAAGRAEAGSLTPPGPPAPTGKPLAEVEPRIAVNAENTPGDSQAVFIISQPGSYYLTGNVLGSHGRHGIAINSGGVTLDLMGFALIGGAGTLNGIHMAEFRASVVIRNGIVSTWGASGVRASIDNGLIDGIYAQLNSHWGIDAPGGFSVCIRNCSAFQNGIGGPGRGGIRGGDGGIVEACLARFNTGIGIQALLRCTVTNCSVIQNTDAGIHVQMQSLVTRNTVISNQADGIRVTGSSNRVEDNHSVGNGTGLSAVGTGSRFSGNTVLNNTTNYAFAGPGNHLELLVSQIPQTLMWPCHAKLAGSLQGIADQSGITIASDDVTIDLGGHELVGVQGSLTGIIRSGLRRNVTIRNGSIRDWGGRGIDVGNSQDGNLFRIDGVSVTGCGLGGIRTGDESNVTNCTARNNGNVGIAAGEHSIVDSCIATRHALWGIHCDFHSMITNCHAGDGTGANSDGIHPGYESTVRNCTATRLGRYGIAPSERAIVEGCTVYDNDVAGIVVGHYSTIRNNTCTRHLTSTGTGEGILILGTNCHVEGNFCANNKIGIRFTRGIHSGTNYLNRNVCMDNLTNYNIDTGCACLVVQMATSGPINGSSGGVSPGSTNPHANFATP